MERAARRLLVFSFVCLLAVLVLGMIRGASPLLFSSAFAVKLVGQRLGSAALESGAFAALVSLGGALLVAAAVAGAVVALQGSRAAG